MDWKPAFFALGFVAAGCTFDNDEDGLSNGQERELGLDIENPDTDGDGLTDGEEVNTTMTDPNSPDTDGDGYFDLDEINEESDPLDGDDWIYAGGWPYYAGKDEIGGQDRETVQIGRRIRRFDAMKDQFRDSVDLYDFYNEDKPIVVDLSAPWCGPCLAVATWLEGEPSYPELEEYVAIREALEEGRMYWVTLVGEDLNGDDVRAAAAREWAAEFPNPHVAVLADRNRQYQQFADAAFTGWPSFAVLSPQLEVVYLDSGAIAWAEPTLQLLDEQPAAE